MDITEELSKLSTLRREGSLTEDEFTAAKQRLLAGESREGSPVPEQRGGDPPTLVFRSSRWSSGNLFFPDAITLAPDGVVFRKRRFLGSKEEHINYRSIASFRIRSGLFLSDISIETSGGTQPITMNGLWKSDARKAEGMIRAFQSRS